LLLKPASWIGWQVNSVLLGHLRTALQLEWACIYWLWPSSFALCSVNISDYWTIVAKISYDEIKEENPPQLKWPACITIPSEWKVHLIVPIYKSADRSSVKNYRPISLLNNASKVFFFRNLSLYRILGLEGFFFL